MTEAAAPPHRLAAGAGRLPSCAIGQRSLGDPSRLYPLTPVLTRGCPATSGPEMQFPVEIDYDYAAVPPGLFDQPPLPGLERWAPLLPPLQAGLSMGEGGTPLLETGGLAAELGLRETLLLKDESRNPTWSHKDRLNLVAVSAACAAGARGIAVASSGNHGVAAAAYAARAGLPCVVITSPDAQGAFRDFLDALGAHTVIASTEERWAILDRIVAHTGFLPVSNLTRFHTGNPFGPEGYKTVAYELFLQLGRQVPGSVVVPTGYGELLFGIAKGFRELQRLGLSARLPRLFSAEPAARGPLARAMATNAPAAEVAARPSAAAGIACTVSSYRGLVALRETNGRALTASEDGMAAAQRRLARQGLWQERSGAAAVAALAEAAAAGADIPGPIVAVLTSSGLKDVAAAEASRPTTSAAALGALLDQLGTP